MNNEGHLVCCKKVFSYSKYCIWHRSSHLHTTWLNSKSLAPLETHEHSIFTTEKAIFKMFRGWARPVLQDGIRPRSWKCHARAPWLIQPPCKCHWNPGAGLVSIREKLSSRRRKISRAYPSRSEGRVWSSHDADDKNVIELGFGE